jgi:hypothetical protein
MIYVLMHSFKSWLNNEFEAKKTIVESEALNSSFNFESVLDV